MVKKELNLGFWTNLPRPFFALAPMADVTDIAFREIIASCGRPDVFYTEFASVEGLMSPGREKILPDLVYTAQQRPIVAQFFGSNPKNFAAAAQLAGELGFDGIDINMGCPEKSISGKQGAGAALIKNPSLAKEIVAATKEYAGSLPVSIKTRIGFSKDELKTWLPHLLETKPAAIILHARTRQQMSKVPADWNKIKQAVELSKNSGTLIIGNGDVTSLEDGRKKAEETGCDGIMVGRATFGNPWFFSEYQPTIPERLNKLLEHTDLYWKFVKPYKPFDLMKKHYRCYAQGFTGAKELRLELMEAENPEQVRLIVKNFLAKK